MISSQHKASIRPVLCSISNGANFHFKFDHGAALIAAIGLHATKVHTEILHLRPSTPRVLRKPSTGSKDYSSPRNADSKFHQRGGGKRCSQFDALGKHVMKNRLLHIRISQALRHCIESSQAEMVHGVCVRVCQLFQHTWYLAGKVLTFLNYSLVGDVNSLIINRLWQQKAKKKKIAQMYYWNLYLKKKNITASFDVVFNNSTEFISFFLEQKPDTTSQQPGLPRPIPVNAVGECFSVASSDGRISPDHKVRLK